MNVSWLNAVIGSIINTTVTTCGSASSQIYDAYQLQRQQLLGNSTVSSVLIETVAALHPRAVYTRIVNTSAEALEHLIYAIVVYLLVCLSIYTLIFRYKGLGNMRLPWPTSKTTAKRVLFVTSHPDDECMFFGPLLYTLAQNKQCQVYLLCLSNGNFEKESSKRREELWQACTHLGIPEGNIILVNATNLPDDPNVDWKTDAVANIILHTVESLGIQAIFTFDRDGVSQHPNHCAVYYAAASLCLANLLPKGDAGYPLQKYLITPFRSAREGSREARFNYIHAKTRNIVERTIGVLKNRFRCILAARQLHYSPEKAAKITAVSAALHNICIHFKVEMPEIDLVDEIPSTNSEVDDDIEANTIRLSIMQSLNI